MRTLSIIILGILFSISVKGQGDYLLLWDKSSSSIMSAEGLITIRKGVSDFEDKYLRTKYWNEDDWKRKSLGIGYRFLKTLLIDIQFDYFAIAHQHEVFGHGARYREFGLENSSYRIKMAPPYGPGSASARRGNTERLFGTHENISTSSAGMEGSSILAKRLRDKWLLNGEINYQESTLFLMAYNDYTLYILSTKLLDNDGDVRSYLRKVNEAYGYTTEESYALSLNDISARASISLLNTYQLFALYTYLKVYLLDGNETFNIPTINIKNIKWLPSARLGLTPFGSEFIIENHLIKNNDLLEVSLRIGDNKLNRFWGGGFKVRKKIKAYMVLQTKFDFWKQPAMELGGDVIYWTKKGMGTRIMGTFNWQFSKKIPVGLYTELGYKTTGFIEGEMLTEGLIARLGFSFKTK